MAQTHFHILRIHISSWIELNGEKCRLGLPEFNKTIRDDLTMKLLALILLFFFLLLSPVSLPSFHAERPHRTNERMRKKCSMFKSISWIKNSIAHNDLRKFFKLVGCEDTYISISASYIYIAARAGNIHMTTITNIACSIQYMYFIVCMMLMVHSPTE